MAARARGISLDDPLDDPPPQKRGGSQGRNAPKRGEYAASTIDGGDPRIVRQVSAPSVARGPVVSASGVSAAAAIARRANMDRAFAIAPTASCSYKYTDRAGWTTTPEIAPPIGRTVDRDSSTFGVQQFQYGEVETAEDVGWDAYVRVVDGIMEMLNKTGLNHGYSFNTWSDVVQYTPEFIDTWLRSPQTSMYYSLQVMQNTQAKDDAMAALDEDFSSLFGFDDRDLEPEDNFCVSCAE